jgi:hypothetical protein
VILLAPEGVDEALSTQLQSQFSELAFQEGLRWQVRQALSPADAAREAQFVVLMPPADNASALIAGAPETLFLAVGIPGLEPAANLIAVGSEGEQPEVQAFLAGYIAALITPDWRVGVIRTEDSPASENIRIAFENGVRFFCGLCRPQSPPFYEYPLAVSLPGSASAEEWRSLANFLVDRQVGAVYVAPGAGDADLLRYLAQAGVQVIGGVQPPEGTAGSWVASIRTSLEDAFLAYWPDLLDGETGQFERLPLRLTDINANLLSPGKQRLVLETLADLEAGYIRAVEEAPTQP